MSERNIEWVDVTSSNIARVAHDATSRTFCVQFTNGTFYSYSDVDRDLFDTIQTVPSVGRYFNMMIKIHHDYLRHGTEKALQDHISALAVA